MNKKYDEKCNYNQIKFSYCKKAEIDEREIHSYHEILYYMGGEAYFLTESFQEKLEEETLIIIPKESYHCFKANNPMEFERLKIGFPDIAELKPLLDSVMTEIKIIKAQNSYRILNKIINILQEQKDNKSGLRLYAAFLMLLTQIEEEEITENLLYREQEHLITRCIAYVDENLIKDISVNSAAKELNVSESTLSHCFKKEMGISFHQYVVQKRLVYARKLISEEEKPTKIYISCGYNDYSSFYKAYLKMFGHPPSHDKQKMPH